MHVTGLHEHVTYKKKESNYTSIFKLKEKVLGISSNYTARISKHSL